MSGDPHRSGHAFRSREQAGAASTPTTVECGLARAECGTALHTGAAHKRARERGVQTCDSATHVRAPDGGASLWQRRGRERATPPRLRRGERGRA
jgi:hypothetical protein